MPCTQRAMAYPAALCASAPAARCLHVVEDPLHLLVAQAREAGAEANGVPARAPLEAGRGCFAFGRHGTLRCLLGCGWGPRGVSRLRDRSIEPAGFQKTFDMLLKITTQPTRPPGSNIFFENMLKINTQPNCFRKMFDPAGLEKPSGSNIPSREQHVFEKLFDPGGLDLPGRRLAQDQRAAIMFSNVNPANLARPPGSNSF